jgi:uncharacterized protein (DUF2236 family)
MGDVGLFGPGTVIWRVNREGVLLAGGGAALILQAAHPLVAAGVAEHSHYREDRWGRLYRTLNFTTKVVFGDMRTAEEAARRVRAAHKRVRGVTEESGGRYPRGTPYNASDPELLMWVHATLVRTALDVYQRYVGALTIAEQRLYYDEQKTLAEMFGVPRERMPDTFAAFNRYVDDTLESAASQRPRRCATWSKRSCGPNCPSSPGRWSTRSTSPPSACSRRACAKSSTFAGAPPASACWRPRGRP